MNVSWTLSLIICYFFRFLGKDGIWTGWTDETEESILRDANSNEIWSMEDYAAFKVGEPNGLEAENCVAMDPDGRWMDFDCYQLSIAPCYIKEMPPQFKLRGKVLPATFKQCYLHLILYPKVFTMTFLLTNSIQ